AWMNSPTHRSNIVKANYSEMGTGVAVGQYKGAEAVFVVQLYANPKIVPTIPQKSSARLAVEEALEPKVAIASEENQPETVAQAETQETTVLGEETRQSNNDLASPNREPSFLESTLASPRNTTTAVFYVVVAIIALALLLNFFIKVGHHHPDLVTNGLFAIVFIFGIYLVNTYVVTASGFETSYTETAKEVVK
ncbi:MAG TPA: CAP domain-containing protein, partial [Candidatus Nanoarchaeia archaeon]|nr:CAP domain-containing protein [Candidatus Nanoarchaeia archaeon]